MKNLFDAKINAFRAVFVLCIIISGTNSFAQLNNVIKHNEEQIPFNAKKESHYFNTSKNSNVITIKGEDPQEVVRLIVTFKNQPLAFYKENSSQSQRTQLTAAYSALQAAHVSFRTSLNDLTRRLSARTGFMYKYTIMREYYTALSGTAVECNRGMVNQIRSLAIVKNVNLDSRVKINLKESVHQIHADKVQDSLGYKGKGVLIGEIDTGIDYDNPALGGGFGPGFRVIGGYDFANRDNDPMDDHGHGTHVAGIIGANGVDTLRGVAPEVKFLSIKALDADGYGWNSDIIAGIDFCLDPDGNPATDDGVDIINMSLGGAASPESPLDIAVNNATEAGVLSVVAAGNAGDAFGNGYGTIGSPGTAETALTVGACNSSNGIPSFSSRGPANYILLKPEVVAPGVQILSTYLHDSTATWSGTSMATPHVAGVAALLKQQHPDWTPGQLKAAIVNSAYPLSGSSPSPFISGNGRADALNAAKIGTIVDPGVISFGIVDLALDVWRDTVVLKIKNFRNSSQNVQLQINGNLPAGVNLTLSQTTLSLAPQEEATISAMLEVPSYVPKVERAPFAYFGEIKCISDSDRINVPFSFIKANLLMITCDMQPGFLALWNSNPGYYNDLLTIDGITRYSVPLASGNYNLFAALITQDTSGINKIYLVERKNIDPAVSPYISISHEEALFKEFKDPLYDINDKPFNMDSVRYEFTDRFSVMMNNYYVSTLLLILDMHTNKDQLFVSPMDSIHDMRHVFRSIQGNEVLALKKRFKGIASQEDITFLSGSSNLSDFNFTFDYDNPLHNNSPNTRKESLINFKFWTITPGIEEELEVFELDIPNPPSLHLMLGKDQSEFKPHFLTTNFVSIGYHFIDSNYGISTTKFRSPEFEINNQGEAICSEKVFEYSGALGSKGAKYSTAYTYQILKPGDTLKIENTSSINLPVFGIFIHKHDLVLWDNTDGNSFSWEFENGGIIQPTGVCEEKMWPSAEYYIPRFSAQLFANNQIQDKISIEYSSYYAYNIKHNDDVYRLVAAGKPYELLGQSGQCSIEFEPVLPDSVFWPFDDYRYPSLNLFQVLGNGKETKWIRPEQEGKIRIVIYTPDSIGNTVGMSLLLASGEEIPLPVIPQSSTEYSSLLPTTLPDGFIDVIARVTDASGSSFELTISPAFYFGSSMNNIQYDSRIRLCNYKLNNIDELRFHPGDKLKYTLLYTNYGNNTATNVRVNIPATDYLQPLGQSTFTFSSVSANDTLRIPLTLEFSGKQPPNSERGYITPAITWSSGGKPYQRINKVPVYFKATKEAINNIPKSFTLYQNYPNPFNPTTTISYDVPKFTHVTLTIYNILGQLVTTLVNEEQFEGHYNITWNGRTQNQAAAGVYFLRLKVEDNIKTIKMILVK